MNFFQLNLQSFETHGTAVHLLDGLMCGIDVVVGDKAEAFAPVG